MPFSPGSAASASRDHPFMKPIPLVLIASLAANLWLGVVLFRPAPPPVHDAGGADRARSDSRPVAPGGEGAQAPDIAAAGSLLETFRTADLAGIRDQMRSAGLPDHLIRRFVVMLLDHRDGVRPVVAPPDEDQAWWKRSAHSYRPTKEQQAAQRTSYRKRAAEIEALLGPDPITVASDNAHLAYLPEAKRGVVKRILQDYNELINEAHSEAYGFHLPSDRDRLKFIEEEKRRDLAAALTPDELQAYDLRNSKTSQGLFELMARIDGSEAEFRTIHAIRQAHEERLEIDERRIDDAGYWTQKAEAETEFRQELREALGERRFHDYLRAQDGFYQQLHAATERFSLPPDTPDRIHALRESVPAAALRIADDVSLDAAGKKAALAKLAADARAQVADALGKDILEAHGIRNGLRWIDELEKGTIHTFKLDGHTRETRVVSLPKDSAQ